MIKERDHYPNINQHQISLVNKVLIIWLLESIFLMGPNGVILPALVANHSTRFGLPTQGASQIIKGSNDGVCIDGVQFLLYLSSIE